MPLLFRRSGGAVLLSLLAATAADARIISIETRVDTFIQRDTLTVRVKITNKGDEPAYSVHIKTEAPSSSATSPMRTALAPTSSLTFVSSHSLAGLAPGHYPLFVQTSYADGNAYPLSALTGSLFQKGKSDRSAILATVDNFDLKKRHKVVLKLKNLENTLKDIKLRFRTSSEMTVKPASLDVRIASDADSTVTATSENFSALPGSTYRLYAVLEYDQGGVHYTTLVPARVGILAAGKSASQAPWSGVLAAGLFMALLIGGRMLWEKRKVRPWRV